VSLAAVLVERGMLSEGEQWLARATPTLVSGPEPAAAVGMHHVAGMLAFVRGQAAAALAAFTAGEEVGEQLSVPHFLNVVEQQWQWRARLLSGETEAVRTALDRAGTAVRTDALWANLAARLHLAIDEGQAALAAVSPVLAGQATGFHANAVLEALFLDALTRHRMGDAAGAEHSVEAALELGEPQGRVWIALTIPGLRDVLAAQPTHRTAHGSYLRTLIDHVSGIEPSPTVSQQLTEPLSERELAVLRLLPTNLSAGEIRRELLLSVHTVKTHMRKLYAKLDAHTRAEAVQRGRALGLLGPNRVR
jgi:LuxR family maltose regulon positive regulatory protein